MDFLPEGTAIKKALGEDLEALRIAAKEVSSSSSDDESQALVQIDSRDPALEYQELGRTSLSASVPAREDKNCESLPFLAGLKL